ncbi:MAG: beta-ketoacyl synthase chain length factor [Proteobacteria bacterium]|nr:beta-ketoacyl synthase chain length factor [Pseudomonadota bacterium]MBU1716733.1 beta-ketoacyl synthase chain length factor [Pseudomonadota bacterium]
MSGPVTVSAVNQLIGNCVVPEQLARELRRADLFIQMAVTSAYSAISGLPADKLHPEEIGVFIGTAYGPLETNFELLGSLINEGEGQISPTLFSHSVYNAAAGYVARLLEIRGPVMTITNYGWPFLIALEEGRVAVSTGRIARAVVIGVETYSELLADAYRRFLQVDTVPWERSAVAWVLEPAGAAKGFCRLQGINLCEYEAQPADLLTRRGETLTGCGLPPEIPRHPMAYAIALSEAISSYDKLPAQQHCWLINASFGRAEINLAG